MLLKLHYVISPHLNTRLFTTNEKYLMHKMLQERKILYRVAMIQSTDRDLHVVHMMEKRSPVVK